MPRRLSTPTTLLVLAGALVAGGGSGVAARAVAGHPDAPHAPQQRPVVRAPQTSSPRPTQPTPTRSATTGRSGSAHPSIPGPSSATTPSASASTTRERPALSAGNAVAVADLDAVGWDAAVYDSTRGQAGTNYPCQRTPLAKQGASVGSLRTVSWAQRNTYSGSETLVQATSEAEARFLFRVVANQLDNCVKNPDLVQGDYTSSPVQTVRPSGDAVARIWRVRRDNGGAYVLVARSVDRVAVLELIDAPVRADPSGLATVARSLAGRLG